MIPFTCELTHMIDGDEVALEIECEIDFDDEPAHRSGVPYIELNDAVDPDGESYLDWFLNHESEFDQLQDKILLAYQAAKEAGQGEEGSD